MSWKVSLAGSITGSWALIPIDVKQDGGESMAKKRARTKAEFRAMYPKDKCKYVLLAQLPVSARCLPFYHVGNLYRPRSAVYRAKRAIPRLLEATVNRRTGYVGKHPPYSHDPKFFTFVLNTYSGGKTVLAAHFLVYADGSVHIRSGHELFGLSLPGKPKESCPGLGGAKHGK